MYLKNLMVLTIYLSYAKASFYKSVKNDGKVKYKEIIKETTARTLISCSHKCRVVDTKSEAFWNKDVCTCLKRSEKEEENDKEITLTGTFLKLKENGKLANARKGKEKKQPLSTAPTVPTSSKTSVSNPSTGIPIVSSGSTTGMTATTNGNSDKKWQRFLIREEELEVAPNILLRTIPKGIKEYVLSLDFKLTKYPSKRVTLLVVTKEKRDSTEKQDSSAEVLSIALNSNRILVTSKSIRENSFQITVKLKNEWARLKISLVKFNGKYLFEGRINGVSRFDHRPSRLVEFTQLYFYTSVNKKTPEAYLRNVAIDVR